MTGRPILLEGLAPDQILNMPAQDLDALVFIGAPVIFRAGSARILGEFRKTEGRLVVVLAHIEGGGEGVLPVLWALALRYARRANLAEVEWIVHAIDCAEPNLKLRRVLERRGFSIEEVPDHGRAYHRVVRAGHPETAGE